MKRSRSYLLLFLSFLSLATSHILVCQDSFDFEEFSGEEIEISYDLDQKDILFTIDPKKGLDVKLPIFGVISFKPSKSKKGGFIAKIPKDGKPVNIGPLTVTHGNAYLIGTKLGFVLKGTFLGKKVSLGLKEVRFEMRSDESVREANKLIEERVFGEDELVQKREVVAEKVKYPVISRIRFGFNFEEKASIKILPSVEIGASSLNFSFDLDERKVEFTGSGELFDRPIDFTLDLKGKESTLKATIKDIPVTNIIPQLKKTLLEPVTISGKLVVENMFALWGERGTDEYPTVSVTGSCDVSKLVLGPMKAGTLDKAKARLQISLKRIFLQASLLRVSIPGLGDIDKARLTIEKEAEEAPQVRLNGQGMLTIEGNDIAYELEGKIEGLNVIFEGTTEAAFTLGQLTLETKAKLAFDIADRSITIMGKAKLQGYGAKIKIVRSDDGRLEVTGTLLIDTFKPFKDLKVPGLSDISMVKPKLKLIKTPGGWGIEVTGAVKVAPNQDDKLQLNGRLFFATGADVFAGMQEGLDAERTADFAKLKKERFQIRLEDIKNLPHLYVSQYYKQVLKGKKGALKYIDYAVFVKDKKGKAKQVNKKMPVIFVRYDEIEKYFKDKAEKEKTEFDEDAFVKEVIKVMAQYSHSKNPIIKQERADVAREQKAKRKTQKKKAAKKDVSKPVGRKKKVAVLEVFLSPHSKLSALFPELKNTVFDSLDLESAALIISSGPYYDEKRDINIVQGINFYGAGRVTGVLANTIKKTGWADLDNAPPVTISGGIGIPDPLKSVLKMSIATGLPFTVGKVLDLPFGFQFKFGELQLELLGSPTPRAALIVTNYIRQSKRNKWCKLALRGGIETTGVITGSGTLQGVWKDPFGIKGVELGNIAIELGIDPKLLVVGNVVPFTVFGATGYFGVVLNPQSLEKNPLNRLRFAGKVSVTLPNDIVLKGFLNRLTLKDLAGAARAMYGINIPQKTIPNLGLQDLSFTLTPMKTKIGDLNFDQGLGGSGTLLLPKGRKASVQFFIDQQGLVLQGYTPTITLGKLILTGAGPDGKFGPSPYDKDNGPIVELAATLAEQKFYLSGVAQLADLLKGKFHMFLRADKIELDLQGKIKGLIDAKVKGYASLYEPRFDAQVDFAASFTRAVQDAVNSVIVTIQKEAKKVVNGLREFVSKLGIPLKNIDQKNVKAQIKQKEQVIETIKKQMAKKGNYSLQAADEIIKVLQAQKMKFDKKLSGDVEKGLAKAVQDINTAIKNLEPLRQKARETAKWWNSLPVWAWPGQGCSRITCIGAYVARKAVFEGPLVIAEGALKLARDFLSGIVKTLVKGALNVGVKLTRPFEDAVADLTRIIMSNPLAVQEAQKAAALRAEIFGLKRLLEAQDVIAQGMKGFERFIDFSAQAGTFAVKTFFPPFHVERVYANVSLEELALKQKLPKVSIDFTLFGVKHLIKDLQIDLNDSPEKIQKLLVNAIVKFLKGSPS